MMKLTALIALLMLLAACQSDKLMIPTTAIGHEPLVCSQWVQVSYASKHDTPETVAQIRRSNAARNAYCAR